MTSITDAGKDQEVLADASASTSPPSDWDNSARRTDTALLVSVLFLERFNLPFHNTYLALDLVFIGVILLYQFFAGKLVIQYDRLLWFLLFAFLNTCSLLANFKGNMLTGYLQFTVFYSLLTLNRPSSLDQYMRTLRTFQFLVMLLSCLAVAQFVAQFVVNGAALWNFYGIVPNVLLAGTMHDPRTFGNGIIKSNALFLAEPSTLSQLTALAILFEVLEFRRAQYLVVLALGFLVAYSGTGLMMLSFLPLAGLRHGKAARSALLVIVFALGLLATGIIDLSAFSSRVSEFYTPGTSGYGRFTAAFLLAAVHFDTASLLQLLIGTGPGTIKYINSTELNMWYVEGTSEWLKIFSEYGIIGSFVFVCYLTACFRRSKCPGLVRAAIIFAFAFLQSDMTLAIPLCTLNGPTLRRRIDDAGLYGPSLASASGSD